LLLIRVILAFCLTEQVSANRTDAPLDFETQIRPLLMQHCAKCHGAAVQKNGLRLDAKYSAFKGGDGGLVIVPGKAEDSELFRRITTDVAEEHMPPEGGPLKAAEIELLKRWIDAGASWPESNYDREAARDPRLDHWAWQPMQNVSPPMLPADLESKVTNDIDRFILAKLAEKRLVPSPEADRRTLIRRLSFDLHGLPPTPDDVDAFVNDSAPQAVEKLVNRLLASPHYGERWARHWLDIAHYADTHGFERDQRRDNAWHYRDWVIKALNAHLPYDQFLRDQIAGDVLRPDDADAVAATGFLAAGPWDFVGQAETPSPVLKRLARADDLDDMVTQVMTASCGITINCARCHDHKLDPISQREYYSLWAVFAGVKRGDRILSSTEQQQLASKKAEFEAQLTADRAELLRRQGSGWNLADIVGGGDGRGSGKAGFAIDPLSGSVTEARRGFLEAAPVNQFMKSSQPFIDSVVIPDDLAAITSLRQRIGELQKQLDSLPTLEKIYGVIAETPQPIHVLLRGDPEQPGDEVTPGTVSCVRLPASLGTANFTDAQRRIALADWIVSSQNPLTARVIVNRLWHHHFGVGIVDTPSDFGLGGNLPSHPELLDWLALQLQADGWSLKSIHRLICLSATYRQASNPSTDGSASQRELAQTADADNRYLWRQNPRRLDAESLRDSVLAVSGKLDRKMFGPGYRDFDYKEEYAPVYTYITADRPELWRRSIYRFVVRTSPDPFLATLDCPNAANLSPTRNVTTTALQSLAMLNNEFMLKQAEYFAARLTENPDTSSSAQVLLAFRSAFGRQPSNEESATSITLIESAGLAEFCRALFNANEFIYID